MSEKAHTSVSWEGVIGALGTLLPAATSNARRALAAAPASKRRPALTSNPRNRRARLQRLDPGADQGFTLVEMLVATAMGIVVLGAVLTMLTTSAQVQAQDAEWAMTVQEGRTGLARMAREIRQATEVGTTKEGGVMNFYWLSNGKTWQTKLNCEVAQSGTSYHECVAYSAEKEKSLPSKGTTLITDVLNQASVFTYSPSSTSPNLVTLKVELPAKGTLKVAGSNSYHNHVVLENGAFMRNLDLAG